MKFLYIIFVVIFIPGSFVFSQQEQKEESSYPKFIPYVSEVNNLKANTVKTDIKEYGKEQPARWLSVDPAASKYPGWSPYNYVTNNPLRNIDPNGNEFTTFIDENGNVKNVDDGSNAVFAATGQGTNLHYEFEGFDISDPKEKGIINVGTIVEEAQNLNMDNPALEPDPNGTYCNFATQNIMNSLESSGINGALISGLANDMQSKLITSDSYQQVDYNAALSNAQGGGLSIYSSLGSRHGHVGTFSIGKNTSKGEVANVGARNGFMNLYRESNKNSNGIYSTNANVLFFILTIPK